jgi:FkbM family methyltransferase
MSETTAKVTYSDNGVDDWLAQHFAVPGMACDVGANVEHGSNTLALEQSGWTVLCVEANPLLMDEGKRTRKLWRSVAAGPEDLEDQTFYSFGGHPYPSHSGMIRHIDGGQEIKVPVRRLDRILEEAGFSRLDLLCVDVEGYESQVMAGLSLDIWKPEVLVIESWLDEFPTPDGYDKRLRLQYDNVYVRS